MTDTPRTITATQNGPYEVSSSVPLRRKETVYSEQGESLTWRTRERIEAENSYFLCRCGGSSNKPFCDGTHTRNGFDGTETAPQQRYTERSKQYPGTGIEVKDDRGICAHAAFCATKTTNVWKMTRRTEDTHVRSQVMAMVERCPSGALTYSVDDDPIEPDLPAEVSVVTDGPLWVTGGVRVQRSDGTPIETRNRMTLCRCGHSSIKPLCDGSHSEVGFRG